MTIRDIKEYFIDIKERLIHIEDKLNIVLANSGKFEAKRDTEAIPLNAMGNFKVAVMEGGGIGDAIIDTIFLQIIYSVSEKEVEIDFFCRAYEMFENYPFIHHAYPYSNDYDKGTYDLVLTGHRFFIVNHAKYDRISQYSEILADYCQNCENLVKNVMNNNLNNFLITRYCLLLGKKRIEQFDVNDVLPHISEDRRYMRIEENALDTLKIFNLFRKSYIVINRDVDGKYGSSHPKLWPLERYIELVAIIKGLYPNIKLVAIGGSDCGLIEGVDINLVGKTTIEQSKVIIKHSLFLISSEGGLVHLAHWLYKKSVVLFGPTLPEVFGYSDNDNIRGKGCSGYCENLINKWSSGCLLGDETPRCIGSISTDEVYQIVRSNIDMALQRNRVYKMVVDTSDKDLISLNGMSKFCLINPLSSTIREIFRENMAKMDIICETSCKSYFRSENVEYILGSRYNIPANDEYYDYVRIDGVKSENDCYFGVLEAMRVLKEEGILEIQYEENMIEFLKSGLSIIISNIEWQYGNKSSIKIRKEVNK